MTVLIRAMIVYILFIFILLNSFALQSRRGKLVCRINPFNMMEYLQLSFEEVREFCAAQAVGLVQSDERSVLHK